MKKFLLLTLVLFSHSAMANYALSQNGKPVGCSDGDNGSIDLNAKRSTLQYTVEGESLGSKKIISSKTDRATYISYTSSEGTLTLSNKGDSYWHTGDQEAESVNCE